MSRRQLLSFLIAVILAFFAFIPDANALGGPQPPLNQPAPDFTLPTNTGEGNISLSDYRGKWVVLYFYPKDFTPGCTLEARRFQQDLPKDTTGDVSKAYGSWMGYVSLRHTYLIDTQGILKEIYLGVNPAIHSAEVLARLEELQANS
ncbi:MAG: peroxiredoxin [Microcystis aeruginosa G13-03]|nr:peroxiredoxin [Microcystis aeruginosa G13-03]